MREENAVAALEVMSRFAIGPRWLVYMSPTMAPPETTPEGELLERSQEAITWYRHEGVPELVCQEKHMSSRAVVVLCRDVAVARQRFGIGEEGRGVIYTRTSHRFFADRATEAAVLDRLDLAVTKASLWEQLASDWIVLDTELMPWSAKAQELLQSQYAPTGAAASASPCSLPVPGLLASLFLSVGFGLCFGAIPHPASLSRRLDSQISAQRRGIP